MPRSTAPGANLRAPAAMDHSLRGVPTLGVGVLYSPLLDDLLGDSPGLVDYLEIIPDMFWTVTQTPEQTSYVENQRLVDCLARWAGNLPVLMHSVGLSIGSAELFDTEHIAQIARWQQRYGCPWHSDHLSFSRLGTVGHDHNAGLSVPMPYDEEVLELVATRAHEVVKRVSVPFLLENNVYFFDIPMQEMDEPTFLNRVCELSGCRLLLDVHNVYANARNHGFDAAEFIRRIDPGTIVEIHVAGGDDFQGMYTDSHAGPVPEAVWQLLEVALDHAPDVRAVTYEFHDSYFREMKNSGVRQQLTRAKKIWADFH